MESSVVIVLIIAWAIVKVCEMYFDYRKTQKAVNNDDASGELRGQNADISD